MKLSAGRILTTHAGSLPRSDKLVSLLAAQSKGEAVDREAFAAEVQASTREVIEQQAQAGIDVGNSGEQSRISFSTYVTLRMSGFGGRGRRRGHKDQNEYPGVMRPRPVDLMNSVPKCIGPLRYAGLEEAEKECEDFLSCLADTGARFEERFMTAASPGIIALTLLNEYYPTYEAYVMTLAEEMRKEYELIVSKGLVLQLDCPDLAMERHVSYQDEPLSAFQELVSLNLRAINRAIRNIPRELVRMHVCWGNSEGPHHYDVPLEDILPLLYAANVGALVLEMANPRHAHEHKVFQRHPLPEHMMLVAGVIDTKTNYIEHPEVVADRIHLAVRAVGDPARVVAGTDCGFDTSAGSNRVVKGIVWEKLKSLRQGAEIASQSVSW
jgi:5-methyltetrahydropteroyltriglutamate--homocysteine methyltransferase